MSDADRLAAPPSRRRPIAESAFRHHSYRLFWTARLLATFAAQIVSVAVGWQIYDMTSNPFDLGLVGLVQFAPALILVLVSGHVADRFNRRAVMGISQLVEALCTAAILVLTVSGLITTLAIFVPLFVIGVARAFMNPAGSSLLPNLVPRSDLASAVTLNSTAGQIANIVGPMAGGLLYGIAPSAAYGVALIMVVGATISISLVPRPMQKTLFESRTWKTILAGFGYIMSEKVVLGAISLDLFAVLLGGATALLPAYARDILVTGPWGLGLLRSAVGLGAIAMAIYLTLRPIRDRAGALMFVAVGMFGIFTVIFGLSRLVWLSALALALAGAADMISVQVRQTLIQLWTPDGVRGRVNAVNNVFIGASNELGAFRAGTMASFVGLVPAVVFGGVGTVAIALLWSWWFPGIRRIRHLDKQTD